MNKQEKLNTIATLAHMRKVKKAAAFDHVRDLINQLDLEDGTSAFMLADLYAYFQPATPAKPKSAIHWISKAQGVKDVRYYLNHLYAKGGDLVATDGHRLHITRSSTLAEGFYNPQGDAVEVSAKYPDYERVIPKGDYVTVSHDDVKIINDAKAGDLYQYTYTYSNTEYTAHFNKRYVDQALTGLDITDIKLYDPAFPRMLISGVIENHDVQAVIMCVKIDK